MLIPLALLVGFKVPKPIPKDEILAAVPVALRISEISNRSAEVRYEEVVALGRRLNAPEIRRGLGSTATSDEKAHTVAASRPILRMIARQCDAEFRQPVRPDPVHAFPDVAVLKAIAKATALVTVEAARRKDPNQCAEFAQLGLRFSNRVTVSGGLLIDYLVHNAVEAIAERAALQADELGGLSPGERSKLLALFPPLRGRTPEAADAVRREFMYVMLPQVIDPIHGAERLFGSSDTANDHIVRSENMETYDPVATVRIVGRQYATLLANLGRPPSARSHEAEKLAGDAEKTLLAHQGRSGSIPNGVGLQLVANWELDGIAEAESIRATRRSLVRAALLLRHGGAVSLPDPFRSGFLHVDRKRRLVWSVGVNEKDDGGKIGTGLDAKAPDLGYRY